MSLANERMQEMRRGRLRFRFRSRSVYHQIVGEIVGRDAMALTVRVLDYFYLRIQGGPHKAYELLGTLASEEINLLAFSAVPYGAHGVELTLFPDRSEPFLRLAEKSHWPLTPAQHACMIQGDDRLGALSEIQKDLMDAGVNIYASTGVTDGAGRYAYVIYFKEGDHLAASRAVDALKCLR